MAQLLRPISTITDQGTYTGASAHGSVDGTAPDTGDYWTGQDNETDVLEVLLTDLSGTPPGSGTCTVNIYQAQADTDSAPSSGGNAPTYDLEVYEGATQRAARTGITAASGSFTLDNALTFAASAITDWSTVRVRFTSYGTAGPQANRRGSAVSYIDISAPDATISKTGTATITGGGTVTSAVEKGGEVTATATAGLGLVTTAQKGGEVALRVYAGLARTFADPAVGSPAKYVFDSPPEIGLRLTAQKGGEGTATVTAGAAVTATGSAGAESHTGTASITGGGTVTSSVEKGAQAAPSVTAGLGLATTEQKGAEAAPIVTGGGLVTSSASRAASVTAAVTAALGLVTSAQKGASVLGVELNAGRACDSLADWFDFSDVALSGPTWSVQTVSGPGGSSALQVTDNATGSETAWSAPITIKPGQEYRVESFVRQTAGDRVSWLLVDFYDGAGVRINSSSSPTSDAANWTEIAFGHYYLVNGQTFPGGWTKYAFSFGGGASATIPSNAVTFKIGGYYTSTGTVESTVQFQDMYVAARSARISAGGAIAVTGSSAEQHSGTATITGGGTVTSSVEKGAQAAPSVTAGLGLVTSAQKGGEGTAAVTAGLGLNLVAQKGAQAAPIVTGGGLVTATGAAGSEAHSGTATITGGGTVTSSVEKGAQAAPSVTAGLGLVTSAQKGAQGTAAVTAGGLVTGTGTQSETHSGTATITGGGTVTSSVEKGAQASPQTTGGGNVIILADHARQAGAIVSGGGQATGQPSTGRQVIAAVSGNGALQIQYEASLASDGAVTRRRAVAVTSRRQAIIVSGGRRQLARTKIVKGQ